MWRIGLKRLHRMKEVWDGVTIEYEVFADQSQNDSGRKERSMKKYRARNVECKVNADGTIDYVYYATRIVHLCPEAVIVDTDGHNTRSTRRHINNIMLFYGIDVCLFNRNFTLHIRRGSKVYEGNGSWCFPLTLTETRMILASKEGLT